MSTLKKEDQAVASRKLIDRFPKDAYVVYTDGACKGNPGQGGSGAVMYHEDKVIKEASEFLGETTNNIAELNAILLGLSLVETQLTNKKQQIIKLLTDSTYCVGLFVKGWTASKNQALVGKIQRKLNQLRSLHTIDIHWIKAHCGLEGNERADALANACLTSTTNTHIKRNKGNSKRKRPQRLLKLKAKSAKYD